MFKTNQHVFSKYFAFLFRQTIKKRAIFITWITYILFIFCFLFIVPFFANLNILNLWANTTFVFCQSLLNIVIAIFTAILAINIVMFSQKDTTNLIIATKQMSKLKMILCRFMVFFAICFLVNISASIIALTSYYTPKFDKQYIWSFFYSMLVGNLINFGFYGAIAIFATIIFSKNAIILINVILNIVLFVWQIITMFAIKIPILQAIDNNVVPETISVIQRQKNSDNNSFTNKYDVKQMVSFNLSMLEDNKTLPISTPNNKAIEQYWQSQQEQDMNKMLNLFDIGSQLTLTYDTFDLQNVINQQAHKTFGISKFHDYKLLSPASPENLLTTECIDWLYVDEKEINIPNASLGGFVLPNAVCFFGDQSSSAGNVIKKQSYVDFSIGTLWSAYKSKTTYVNFTSDEWNQYYEGFDEMYENIFINPSDLKTINGGDFFTKSEDQKVNWASNENISKYYELIWSCLAKKPQDIISNESWNGTKANKTTFNIFTVDDLNIRFIQFKHYVYWKLVSEQKDMFLHPTNSELEKINILSQQFDNFWSGDDEKKTWYVFCDENNPLLINNEKMLEDNTKTPALKWIKDFDDEQSDETTYKKYLRQSNIFNNCVANEEKHMFNSLDEPQRSNKHRGKHFMVQNQYVPWPVTKNNYYGHNLGLFFYETQPRFNLYSFCIIWGLISLSIYTLGFIIYQRHDIK